MLTRTYTLRFVTPAFLGNAEQDGQWRTPPVKALLRQWWRVAYAADQTGSVNIFALRAAEGRLFGVAADGDGDSRKSQVRIRLSDWSAGKLKSWDGLEQRSVHHPETERTGYKVGPHAYLGYGPLDGRGNTRFSEKVNAAIKAEEHARWSLAFPDDEEASNLDRAIWLMHRFGTLGGRSRNGWGSFALMPADDATPKLNGILDERLVTTWQDGLRHDWPHAIGRDAQGPLIWQTEAVPDWKAAMRLLAEIRIGLRTQQAFKFTTGKNAAEPQARHWLSYPVTNHNVEPWRTPGKGDFRLPNSLRFKVRAEPDGKLHAVVFHMPCLPPAQFRPDRQAITDVWQRVHTYLDQPVQRLKRIPA